MQRGGGEKNREKIGPAVGPHPKHPIDNVCPAGMSPMG
jgi:hypothetical protein